MNFLQRFWYAIQVSDNDPFIQSLAKKDEEIKLLKQNLDNETKVRIESQNQISELVLENNKINDQIFNLTKIDPLEEYWNNKREKTSSYLYGARTILGGVKNINVDPRIFWQLYDSNLPKINGSNNDEKAMNALKYVINNITYTSDTLQFKFNEEWLFPWETYNLRKGDCEDGAILLANIMLKSGIPYWRIRLNAGDVKGGGHCWVTYLREDDNNWYILDWCYWPEKSVKWLEYKTAEDYFKIWFSFNTKYIYLDETFEREQK